MPVKGCRSIPWLYARLLSNSVSSPCHALFGSEHPFYMSISEDSRDNNTCCRAPGDRTVSTRIQYIYLFRDDFCTHTFNDRNANTYRTVGLHNAGRRPYMSCSICTRYYWDTTQKVQNFLHLRLLNLTESLRACTLIFFTQY